jgi:hypothetical protein
LPGEGLSFEVALLDARRLGESTLVNRLPGEALPGERLLGVRPLPGVGPPFGEVPLEAAEPSFVPSWVSLA